MPQKGFKVEPDILVRSANVINDKTSRYETEVQNIYTAISDLKMQWKGQTSEAFNAKLEGYRNDFQELAKVLKEYANFLVQTANKYNATDNKLAGDAQRLSIGK